MGSGGDAFLSNCAKRGTAYRGRDKKGSYAQAKCSKGPPPTKPKRQCKGSDFMQAGKGGNSDPFAVMQWCSDLKQSSKVCEICACVSELDPRAVRRHLDCNVHGVSFVQIYNAHKHCKPCSFSGDGPVVVHG